MGSLALSQREYDEVVQRQYPLIRWGEPMQMRVIGVEGPPHFGCRLCIARTGIKGYQIRLLPTDANVIRRHIAAEHSIT